MAYTPNLWVDRLVQFARRFTVTDLGGGMFEIEPEPGEVTEAGTPVNAANLNTLENGLADHTTAAMPHQFVDGGTTYRYGLRGEGGHLIFMYEEVT